jgi:hypothetical protein
MMPAAIRFKTTDAVEEVLRDFDGGYLYRPSILVEDMLRNPRVRGTIETRLNGLIGTAIRWEPGRQNAAGRRAAKAMEEDWPLIASATTRKQSHKWGLLAGVSFAQKHWYRSASTGRAIPRLEHFHSSSVAFDWSRRVYRIAVETMDGRRLDVVEVASPSITVDDEPGPGLWVVHEPFGKFSWREAFVLSAWQPWMSHALASRDSNRASERQGMGIVKVTIPHGVDKTAAKDFVSGVRKLNSEGLIPCTEFDDGRKFDAELMQYDGGAGYDIIDRTRSAAAIDLAILILGHNLTTEAKGGSYAAANVGDLIRGDIKEADAKAEWTTLSRQVIAPWAEVNFGDPELAPRAVYETDPPAINQAAAQTLQFLSQAVESLTRSAPQADVDALLERFRVPLKVAGKAQVQVAGNATDTMTAPAMDGAPPADGGNDTPAKEDAP